MRNSFRNSGLAVLVILVSASVSQAATLSLVGVGDVDKPSTTNSTDTLGSKAGYGAGAIVDFGGHRSMDIP